MLPPDFLLLSPLHALQIRSGTRDGRAPRGHQGITLVFRIEIDFLGEHEKKPADCGQRAAKVVEPVAAELRQEAKICREWVDALRSGRWTS